MEAPHIVHANRRKLIREQNLGLDIDSWYQWLSQSSKEDHQQLTFQSANVKLTPDEAQAIIHEYTSHHAKRKKDFFQQSDVSLLAGVELGIQAAMDSLNNNSKKTAFFVRLFSRSPKDGKSVYAGEEAMRIYQNLLIQTKQFLHADDILWSSKLQLLPKVLASEINENTGVKERVEHPAIAKYCAFALTDWALLRADNAKEAMALLTSSERVRYDLSLDLDCHLKMDMEWTNGIMVRQWDERIRPDLEFRCFANNKKITAISQYDPLGYFPHVVKHKDEIREAILAFFDAFIKPIVPLNSFVIDIAVIPSVDPAHRISVVVVELNPFDQWTSGALFDWETDKQILHGDQPFEFRLHTSLEEKFISVVQRLEEKFIAENKRFAKEAKNQQRNAKAKSEAEKEDEEDEGEFVDLAGFDEGL